MGTLLFSPFHLCPLVFPLLSRPLSAGGYLIIVHDRDASEDDGVVRRSKSLTLSSVIVDQ